MNDLEVYREIIETMIARLLMNEDSNSISQMIIIQLGTLLDTMIELSEAYLQTSDQEELSLLSTEMISYYGLVLERMIRSYDRCSLVTDSNNDVLVYNRAYNYIVDMLVNDLLNIDNVDNDDLFYQDVMIAFYKAGISMARNALRFRLCRELIDILREVIIFMSDRLKMFQGIDIN